MRFALAQGADAFGAGGAALVAEAKAQGARAVLLSPGTPPAPAAAEAALKTLCKAAYQNACVVVAPLGAETAVVAETGVVLARGAEPGVVDTSAGRLALVLGHGGREQAAVAELAAAGAQVVLVAGTAPAADDRAAWEARYPRAAADHKVHIGALNRRGGGSFGASYFCAPNGVRLRELSADPELAVADLELPD